MEFVQTLIRSPVATWRSWSPIQRTVFGTAAAVILIGAVTLVFQHEATRYVPLSLGKQFSTDDLANIEQSLRERNLNSFRREGSQLLVPEHEQTSYDAALLQERQLPRDWASEWEQQFDATNPFTSARKLQMLKEIALAKELKRIIQGLDGIEEANVVWAETQTRGWPSRRQRVTASVNIRPRQGRSLSEQTIRAIQFSVANMVPNLEPEDVIVLDYTAGRHYQLQPEQARFETELQDWMDREVARWTERLQSALVHHWPDAQIDVRLRREELRQVAWELMPSERGEELHANRRTVHDLAPALQQRFPQYMLLTVTLPDAKNSGTDTGQAALEDEVLAALVGWLPPSFGGQQLRVIVESTSDIAELEASGNEPTASWQSAVMVGAAGILLLLVSLRYQSSSHDAASDIDREAETAETSPAGGIPTVQRAAPPVTPLGDPELVADVLKQWLGSSHVPDNDHSPSQSPREAD